MVKNILLFLFSLLVLNSCAIFNPIPQPKREFRGFWVATVVNIDWPKKGADPIEKQKTDYLKILDFYDSLNFNAAIVQVRTAGDAFYGSDYAPWSRFLTGEEGKAPETDESILKWMIVETHARGMEFHAWLNPYRATFNLNTELLSPDHDYNQHPEWMLKYGKKFYYDPGLPDVRERMVSVIDELVSNFDIDAVHFDDYFYPYTIAGEVFGDSLSFEAYAHEGQSLEDWRRSNINMLVKDSYEIIKARKPWVQLGISPFGVWKNKATDPRGSDTKAGQTTYENLYADPLLWMEKGWLDYLVPQVYWSMDLPVASHRKIVDWWAENSTNGNLYIGNGPYKIRNNSDKAWDKKRELPKQLRLARNTGGVQGNVFFSAKSLMESNADVVKYLRRKFYKWAALPPASPWMSGGATANVEFESMQKINDSIVLNFKDLRDYRFITIYPSGRKTKSRYPIKKLLGKLAVDNNNSIILPKTILGQQKQIALIFIDRFGRESQAIIVDLE
ncbi:glycoside hydrolase family 10 protein [Pricia sp.]|uniref:glycoside hydrolase family 10 protein n=1 Tax=Pricia sp. TaxID=2268138 RepID=UPI003593CBED